MNPQTAPAAPGGAPGRAAQGNPGPREPPPGTRKKRSDRLARTIFYAPLEEEDPARGPAQTTKGREAETEGPKETRPGEKERRKTTQEAKRIKKQPQG